MVEDVVSIEPAFGVEARIDGELGPAGADERCARSPDAFVALLYQHLDTWQFTRSDQRAADRMLAEAYERKGDHTKAVYWYEAGKKYISNPQMVKEIETKIKSLQ